MKNSVDQLVESLRQKGPVAFLESQSREHPASNVSYLAALPTAAIEARGAKVSIRTKGGSTVLEENPWKALSKFRKEYGDWMFGYLGYDMKNHLEQLSSGNPDPVKAPDMYFMIPGLLLEIGQEGNEIKVIKGELPDYTLNESALSGQSFSMDSLRPAVSREVYLSRIREAQRRITEGEFYEINLSHQMRASCAGDSYQLYKKMRSVGPVPFGAYLSFDEWTVCSLSPERFLRRDDRRVFSQPIKGTTHRGGTPSEDASLKEELKNSLKDRAENLMIVDLVRNDLSRIALKNSVDVSGLFEIQTFGTVHQMVSTVVAETEVEDPIEIIKACYPMGSMTGAPKISAMKSIEELENYRRGIYSGAIGYFEPGGDFDFNVVIRTAIIREDRLFYSVGGAITGDSEPQSEWEETIIKARALTNAMKG